MSLGLTRETWLALGVGTMFGFVVSLLATVFYHWLLRPNLTITTDDGDPAPGKRPSIGSYAFFHLIVKSSSHRLLFLGTPRIPQAVRATITIQDGSRSHTFITAPARWAGWAEPITLVPLPQGLNEIALTPFFDSKEAARQRTFNFESPGQSEQIDLVLKVEGQNQMYFWNNDNFREGWLHDGHRLEQGDYHVKVTVECEGRTWLHWFSLSNVGTSWRDIRVAPLPK